MPSAMDRFIAAGKTRIGPRTPTVARFIALGLGRGDARPRRPALANRWVGRDRHRPRRRSIEAAVPWLLLVAASYGVRVDADGYAFGRDADVTASGAAVQSLTVTGTPTPSQRRPRSEPPGYRLDRRHRAAIDRIFDAGDRSRPLRATNATSSATSSGVFGRPIGMPPNALMRSWRADSSSLPAPAASLAIIAVAAAVSVKPGAILSTRTPFGPISFDKPLLYVVSAAFAAAYASVDSKSGIRR